MKRTRILYWIFTVLFAFGMISSAIPGLEPSADSVKMLHDQLGYPVYFIRFISVAKILGALALVIPVPSKIREWAYAGLIFDLVGALYSVIAVTGTFDPGMLFIVLILSFGGTVLLFMGKNQEAVLT